MTITPRNRKRVQVLPVSEVESYLIEHGWQRTDNPNPNALVFSKVQDDQTPLVLVLPARENLVDANRRLNDVIRSLATLETLSPDQLVQRILARRQRRRTEEKMAKVG